MTTISSEYSFPIFISSTDYNLIDLRAELAKYLSDLGYKPILSSSEGFHDNSPELEPWESCLQVLQSAYIMVLVIDGKYGTKLEWKNFNSIIGDKKISPTHAEYIFAHKTKMRMLVFNELPRSRAVEVSTRSIVFQAKQSFGELTPKRLEKNYLLIIKHIAQLSKILKIIEKKQKKA